VNYSTDSTAEIRFSTRSFIFSHNVKTGAWDGIVNIGAANGTMKDAIPNPTQYVGPKGDVTLRLISTDVGKVPPLTASFSWLSTDY